MPKISLPTARRIIISVVIGTMVFAGGYFLGQRGIIFEVKEKPIKVKITRDLPADKKTLDFNLFWQVWDRLHRDFLHKNELDDAKLVFGAIRGMVAAAGDPYTTFLEPSEQKVTAEDLSGSFEGVGIQIGFKGTQLAVIAPLEGSPADKAGLKGGDFILFIKDEERDIKKGTVGIDLPSAVDAIRGPAGTSVVLTIAREGVEKPFEVTLTRAKIDVPSVELKWESPSIGKSQDSQSSGQVAHLKLLKFGESTTKEWEQKVGEILAARDVKGVVLDLRNNPGGFLTGAVYIGSEFIKSGTVVIQEDAKGTRQNFTASGRGRLTKFPLVVLVNKGSASASEIVAGALQDTNRAKIIGVTSFGKGTIQEAQEIEGGAGLHITTAKWLTPKERWINEKGIEPDVKIEDKDDTEEDEQLEAAIQLLK